MMTGITRIERHPGLAAEAGLAEILFCDRVSWDDEGRMTTGPHVYARRHDGGWVEACSYIVLCRTGGAACAEPDGVIDAEADARMRQHFARLGLPPEAARI